MTLAEAPMSIVGRLATASNLAVLVEMTGPEGDAVHGIYKPVRGERPLWDFPDGTLAGREVATHLVARAGQWGCVPPTVLRDGELGPGSVQLWIGDPYGDDTRDVVDLVAAGESREGWVAVLEGVDASGRTVEVIHEDAPDVRSMAVLDAVVNNSDRKGSHAVRDGAGRLWGFDHGVCLHHEPKLRTVLWAWAGEPIPDEDLTRLGRLRDALDGSLPDELDPLLPPEDIDALRERVDELLATGRHPEPSDDWPSVPWPPL